MQNPDFVSNAASRMDAPPALQDKARLTAGASFWSTVAIDSYAPGFTLTDGPNGMRKQTVSFDHMGIATSLPATCFPSACLSSCTFDPALVEMQGRAIGEECREEDVAVLLGPAVNTKRHPLGGRNFEYFSEDPLLSGKMAAAFVKGLQSTGVAACVKHMAANSQEIRRMASDSVVDEATLNDIYLRPFELVVKEAHPAAIMPAYNRLNGTLCSENAELLEKPRSEWGFEGAYISDWGGMDDSVRSIEAGLDLCMPGPRADHVRAVTRAVNNGELSLEALDRASSKVAALGNAYESSKSEVSTVCDHIENAAIAQVIAEAGCVLLKNEGALPIDPAQKIALIGAFAKHPRYQGSGSSKVNPIVLDSASEAFEDLGFDLQYAAGYDAVTGKTSDALLSEAAALAAESDIAIVFVGLPDSYESEGFDRYDLELPRSMDRLVERVANANPNTAVVVSGGGVVEMPWADDVSAILATYLPGCRGGHAVVNILTGKVNPSGRLAESWPLSLDDTVLGNDFPIRGSEIHYIEGPFVGYRYYQAAGVPVAYPFGHGLSFTRFEYSDAAFTFDENGCDIELTVKNAGERDGFEVIQVYVAPIDAAYPAAPMGLQGFKRVFIPAGESSRVQIHLDPDAFSHWDAAAHKRAIDAGTYELRIGASSEDIRIVLPVELDRNVPFEVREPAVVPAERMELLEPYFHVTPHGFTEEAFAALYDAPLPVAPPVRPFTPNSRLGDLRETKVGRFLLNIIEMKGREVTADDPESNRMLERSFEDLPLRSLVLGKVPYEVVTAFTGMLNGHPISAIRGIIGILTYNPGK